MTENYCGKDCTRCSFKEALACVGCKTGPGRAFGGDCEIARCCCIGRVKSCLMCWR